MIRTDRPVEEADASSRIHLACGLLPGGGRRGPRAFVPEEKVQGPADALIGYLPDLERDIREPLPRTEYRLAVVAALGEGLDG